MSGKLEESDSECCWLDFEDDGECECGASWTLEDERLSCERCELRRCVTVGALLDMASRWWMESRVADDLILT